MFGEVFFLNAGVLPSEVSECCSWAFGEDFMTVAGNSLGDRWNKRHDDIFEVSAVDRVDESFERIGKAYLEHKKVEV